MDIIGSCLTVLGVTSGIATLHAWFTGLKTGKQLDMILNRQSESNLKIEKLAERILYTPSIQQVHTVNETSKKVEDLRKIREILEPVQVGLNSDILSTAVLSTPAKLRKAFEKNPFEVLIEARPINRIVKPNNPDLIPVLFYDSGIYYVGWQTSGALPILFDCNYYHEAFVKEVKASERESVNKKNDIYKLRNDPRELSEDSVRPEESKSKPAQLPEGIRYLEVELEQKNESKQREKPKPEQKRKPGRSRWKLTVLLLLLVPFCVIVYNVSGPDEQSEDNQLKMGENLFAELPVEDIAFITIKSDKDSVVLRKEDSAWIVENGVNYPANFSMIRDLVNKVKETKIGRSFKASDEILSNLSLHSPDKEGVEDEQKGIRITVEDNAKKVLADMIIGGTRESSSGKGGHYVMLVKSPTIYLVDKNYRYMNKKPSDWIDPKSQ